MMPELARQSGRLHDKRAGPAVQRRAIRHAAPFPRAGLRAIGPAHPAVAAPVEALRLDFRTIGQGEHEMQFNVEKRIAARVLERQFHLPDTAVGRGGGAGDKTRHRRTRGQQASEQGGGQGAEGGWQNGSFHG